MTDDDFDKVDEDFASEFDFVDNKNASTGGTPGSTPPTGGPPKNSSAMMGLIVIISLLGGGYYAYSHFFAKKPVPTPPTPPAQNELPSIPGAITPPQSATTPADATTPVSMQNEQDINKLTESLQSKDTDALAAALPQPSEKTFAQVQKDLQSAQQTPQTAIPVEMRAALQSLSDEMTVNVNNIKQLEGTISTLNTTVDQLNKTITAMDNRVLSLTETVDGLSQDLTNVKKVMVDEDLDLTSVGTVKLSNSKKQTSAINNAPSYSVHAIIPGRAWLKSSNGQIITVTEGDNIGDYGKVSVIDSANGLVRTSSGIIIR